MKAAKEAAAKVNAMLVASGQLKLSDIEKAKCNKTGNLFVEEVVINDAPMSARNFLTMCSTQEEISKMSGASVSTKGRYMTDDEIKTNSGDRPLHLQIQGVNEQDVKVAVGRIMHIIMKHSHRKPQQLMNVVMKQGQRKPQQQKYKGNKNFGANQIEKHNQRMPNKEENPFPVQNLIYREKVFMPPTAGLNPSDMRIQLIGENCTNFKYISEESGVSVTLRGIGSGYLESDTGQEVPEALHFYLEHSNQDQFNRAKELVVNLAQTILSEMQEGLKSLAQSHLNTIQPNIVSHAQLPCKPLQANGNPLPMGTTFEAQQLYGAPQVIVPAVQQQVISSLAPPLVTHAVTPINSFQQQQAPQPYVITSQPIMSVSHNAELVAGSGNNIVAPIIPISVQTNVQETSQILPQLLQVSHGAQIIGTPDGPRLITVVCTANGAPIVTEPSPITTFATLQAPLVQQPHPGVHVVQSTVELAPQQEHYDGRGEQLHAPVYPHVTLPIVTATMQSSQVDTLTLPQANVTYQSGQLITAQVECANLIQNQSMHVVPSITNEINPQFAMEVADSQNLNTEPLMNAHASGSEMRHEYENPLLLQHQPGQLPWSRYSNLTQNAAKPGHEMSKNFIPDDPAGLDSSNLSRLRDGGVPVIEDKSCRPYGLEASFAPNFYQHTGVRPYSVDHESNLKRCGINVSRGMLDDIDETSGRPSSSYRQSGYPSQIENVLCIDQSSSMGMQPNVSSVYARRADSMDVKPAAYTGPIEYNHSMRPKYVPPQIGRENSAPSPYSYSSRRPFSHQRNY